MLIKFTADVLLGTGLGVVVGAFMPSIGRKIKAAWVKEGQIGKKDILTGLDATVKKVESKL